MNMNRKLKTLVAMLGAAGLGLVATQAQAQDKVKIGFITKAPPGSFVRP